MRKQIGVGVALIVAGCANPALEQRKTYLSQLIGQPVEAVVSRLGTPVRDAEQEGHHSVTFLERRMVEQRPLPTFGPPSREGVGRGGSIRLGEMVEGFCETTFDVVGGTVRGYRFRGTSCGQAPAPG